MAGKRRRRKRLQIHSPAPLVLPIERTANAYNITCSTIVDTIDITCSTIDITYSTIVDANDIGVARSRRWGSP